MNIERPSRQFSRFHVTFCLSHNFVYLLYFCSSWGRS